MDKIKILAIPSYAGMANVFAKIAEENDNIIIKIYDGQNISGHHIARYVKTQKPDVIIACGDVLTLESVADIPVVRLAPAFSDILRTLKMVENIGGKLALVNISAHGYSATEEYTRTICELLRCEVDFFNIASGGMTGDVIRELEAKGYGIILGGRTAVEAAQQYGLQGVQITYGSESVRNAVEKAVLIHKTLYKNSQKQRFYCELLDECSDYLIVQDDDGKIVYNNADKSDKGLSELLKSLEESGAGRSGYNEMTSGDVVWGITRKNIKESGYENMTAIYFRKLRFVDSTGGGAISYMHGLPSPILTRFYSYTNRIHNIKDQIDNFSHVKKSVLISGEWGLGKEDLAFEMNGGEPMIRIDCNNLTTDSLNNFVETGIYDMQGKQHAALLIANADIIAPELQYKLADLLENISRQTDIRIIATSSDEIFKKVAHCAYSDRLYRLISQVCVSVPPLRSYIKDIDAAIGLLISYLNADLGTQVVGFRPDAMERLKEYGWEGNVQQLIDVLRRLLLISRTVYITLEDLEKILAAETNTWNSRGESVLWKGTLDDITKRIIKAVLVDENMNQTKTANRLGISRSTLWKKIK